MQGILEPVLEPAKRMVSFFHSAWTGWRGEETISRRYSLEVTAVVTLFLTTSLVGLIIYNTHNRTVALETKLKATTDMAQRGLATALWNYDFRYIEDFLDAVALDPNVVFTRVAGSDGKTIAKKISSNLSHAEYEDFIRAGKPYFGLKRAIHYQGNASPVGNIEIVMSSADLRRDLMASMLAALFLTVLVGAAITITSIVITRREILEPILKLEGTAAQITEGKYDTRLDMKRDDEIGRLASSLDRMQLSIQKLVTDLSTSNNQLQEALKLRDEFISIAAHELRTPLTPLKLQLQVIQKMLENHQLEKLPEEKRTLLTETASRQLSRLTSLVDDLLDVSRMARGTLTLSFEKISLVELARDVVARFQSEIATSNSTVDLVFSAEVEGVFDPLRIEQVLVNLLTNAMKYGGGKPIRISIDKTGEKSRILVQDQGMGIRRADQSRIFERFERAVSLTNFGGLGLGLYISKQIVEAHGGTIQVESEYGKGSTFIVEIPLHPPQR